MKQKVFPNIAIKCVDCSFFFTILFIICKQPHWNNSVALTFISSGQWSPIKIHIWPWIVVMMWKLYLCICKLQCNTQKDTENNDTNCLALRYHWKIEWSSGFNVQLLLFFFFFFMNILSLIKKKEKINKKNKKKTRPQQLLSWFNFKWPNTVDWNVYYCYISFNNFKCVFRRRWKGVYILTWILRFLDIWIFSSK